jgi:hypothetical protein
MLIALLLIALLLLSCTLGGKEGVLPTWAVTTVWLLGLLLCRLLLLLLLVVTRVVAVAMAAASSSKFSGRVRRKNTPMNTW